MFQKSLMALALTGTIMLVGCGGGGGSSGGSNTTAARNDVAGPLDTVQGPLSSQVLDPLAAAVAGTPLQGVVGCLDQAVVNDVVDVVDAIAVGVQPGASNPAAALNATAANVQAELGDLVSDLQGLLTSLAGGAGCNGSASPIAIGSNPLAGTPLASLGTQLLPVLNSLQTQLNGSGGAVPSQLSLSQLTGLLGQLNQAFSGGLALVPPQAASAPVVGPALDLVSQALADLQVTLAAAAAGNPSTAATGVTNTVQNLLDNLLTKVIPLSTIETTSGQPGAVTAPIQSAIDQLTAALGGGLGSLPTGALGNSLMLPSNGLFNPFDASVLPLLLDPITSAIGGGTGGSGVGGVTGTPLDGVLNTITGVLSGGVGGDPLTSLLGSLLGSTPGAGGTCPLTGTPLAGLCGILG